MSGVIILHHPRCTKSLAALTLLRVRGCAPRIVDYLKSPPSVRLLDRILGKLDLPPRGLMRRNEPDYAELDLDNPALSREQLLVAMHERPRLLQRPIILAHGRAVIGHTLGAVLAILRASAKERKIVRVHPGRKPRSMRG